MDPVNVMAMFEVRSYTGTRYWDNNDWSFGWQSIPGLRASKLFLAAYSRIVAYNLSVESNQNVESKWKSAESRSKKTWSAKY